MKYFALCFLLFVGFSSEKAKAKPPTSHCPQLIEYSYFQVCYSERHRQAYWTKHTLSESQVGGKQKRTNDYRRDPDVVDGVTKFDYQGSGFDRGHLVPAADMKLNLTAMSETFFMTNMSPQRPAFNRKIWAWLESEVRKMVLDFGEARVITLPLLSEGLSRLKSGVSVPEAFIKIAYFKNNSVMKAWLIGNHSNKGPLQGYQITVDEAEELSGFDFFSDIDDALEDQLESELQI